jgi:hypothetical protein
VTSSTPAWLTIITGSLVASFPDSPSGSAGAARGVRARTRPRPVAWVVRDDARGNRLALLVDEAHFVGFVDQIADRDEKAVVGDGHGRAFALLAEGCAAARIGHRAHLDLEDRLKEFLGIGRQRMRCRSLRARVVRRGC